MNAIAVSVISNFIDRPWISSFQYAMFHGKNASRTDPRWPDSTEMPPLEILHNGHRVPSIFRPQSQAEFVVADTIAKCLTSYDLILLPIVPKKVIRLPWEIGNRDWHGENPGVDPDILFEKLPHHSELVSLYDGYMEVITWLLNDVTREAHDGPEYCFEAGASPFNKTVQCRIPVGCLEKYGILYHEGAHVIQKDLFRRIGKHFDQDFFVFSELKKT